jgi:hypothetical protein
VGCILRINVEMLLKLSYNIEMSFINFILVVVPGLIGRKSQDDKDELNYCYHHHYHY